MEWQSEAPRQVYQFQGPRRGSGVGCKQQKINLWQHRVVQHLPHIPTEWTQVEMTEIQWIQLCDLLFQHYYQGRRPNRQKVNPSVPLDLLEKAYGILVEFGAHNGWSLSTDTKDGLQLQIPRFFCERFHPTSGQIDRTSWRIWNRLGSGAYRLFEIRRNVGRALRGVVLPVFLSLSLQRIILEYVS